MNKHFVDNYLTPALAAAALIVFLCSQSKAQEAPHPDAILSERVSHLERSRFTVPFKPLRRGPAILEAAWQAENVIDLQQTLRIARDPTDWREVGTMSLITGAHPTVHQVWWVTAAFGLAHYGVSQILENHGMTKTLTVWQLTSLGAKTWNMKRNIDEGLGY